MTLGFAKTLRFALILGLAENLGLTKTLPFAETLGFIKQDLGASKTYGQALTRPIDRASKIN